MAHPNIRSFYEGDRSRTEVDGSFPVIPPLTARDQLMALADQESGDIYGARPRPAPRPTTSKGVAYMPEVTQTRGGGGEGGMLREVNTPWYSQQGAAMRPVGLGAQMIPGMGIDPRFLPPGMRPGGSQFVDETRTASGGQSGAGPSDFQRPAPQSSNSGFDYLPAVEQARWLAAYGRG